MKTNAGMCLDLWSIWLGSMFETIIDSSNPVQAGGGYEHSSIRAFEE
jgi:hypothetical protein